MRSFGVRSPGVPTGAAGGESRRGSAHVCTFSAILGIVGMTLVGCSSGDKSIKTSAGYPPVKLKPSGLPTYAVGDRFTFNNPDETWTVIGIRDGLVKWRSSLKAEKITVFDPVLPPIVWSEGKAAGGSERLLSWDKTLFPLKKGQKISFTTKVQRKGAAAPLAYTWKCYSGGPRKVKIQAGEFPAYPIFCRRSDGWTRQSFYAPDVNGSLLITTRKRPAPAIIRELTEFQRGPGPRIAAIQSGNLPKGLAIAGLDATVRARAGRPTGARTAAATPAKDGTKSTVAPSSSGPRSIASPVSSPAPKIPSPPKILPPGSTVARPPVQEALTTIAIGPPKSPIVPKTPIVSKAKVTRPAKPNVTRPAPRAAANTGARARAGKSAAPALPSIQAPASIFGRRTTPAPPVIALPTPARKSNKADKPLSPAKRPAPLAKTATRSADTIPPRQRRTAGRTFGVQLGSYAKPEMAKDGWKTLRRRFGPLLKNWDHQVKHVDLGSSKGRFYRLIAGPAESRTSAEALCTAIKARGKSCLVRSLKN